MVARYRGQSFAYALVSAAPLQDTNAAGIGIVFKAHDRSTIRSVCQALPGTEVLEAAYEAVMRVLEEALQVGKRRLTIYTDIHEMVQQLADEAEVPRALLVKHLKTRGMINQLQHVNLVVATSDRFSARLLAEEVHLPGERTSRDIPGAEDQLTLMPEDAPA